MARKLTPMQEAFRHEQQRLKRAISREFRKTGLKLDKSLIPEMPKRVTQKRLQEIKEIKPFDLRKQTQYVDYETGEIIDYKKAKNLWQEQQKISTPYTLDFEQQAIDGFFDTISKYNQGFQMKMRAWINGLIDQYGKSAVAQMLIDGFSEGVIITNRIAYSDDACAEFMADLLNYLRMDARTKADILSEIEASIGYEKP